jgi:hypothetical protein
VAGTTAAVISPVGPYTISVSGGEALNYDFNYVFGTLNVIPAPLSIVSTNMSRTYGATNPTFTGTITGILNSDPITATYWCGAVPSSPAGPYPIVPTACGPANVLSNYAINPVNGTLTVLGGLALSTNAGYYVIDDPATLVDTNATLSDGGGIAFGGATLTLSVVSNATPEDVLSIEVGTNASPVNVTNANVFYNGTLMATYRGGSDSNPLVFTFNTNANAIEVSGLMQQLTFATDNTNTASRVFQFTIAYGSNVVSGTRAFVLDRPPVAADLEYTAAQGMTLTLSVAQFLTNCYDVDGDALAVTSVSDVSAYGGLLTTQAGVVTYRPPSGSGSLSQDLFAYIVSDGRGGQDVGIVTLKFMAPNRLQLDLSNVQSTGAQITMAGIPGRLYAIQASTDFVHWTTIESATASSTGLIQFLDCQAKTCAKRFYRAVLQ